MSCKILIVDDHPIFLEGLKKIISSHTEYEIAGIAPNGNYALSILKTTPVDILLTDYAMPDMCGLELIEAAKKTYPLLKVIVLSMYDEPFKIKEMLAYGINSYILKKNTHNELSLALEAVNKGNDFWSPEINNIIIKSVAPQNVSALTERELEILKLLIDERTSKEIANKLFISERTVETHRKNMLRKTNAQNTIGLVKYAFQNSLVS